MSEQSDKVKVGDGSELYPVLPLRDIVVFPHMIVPLFVGRDKSINALEEVMRSDKHILLAALSAGVKRREAAAVALISLGFEEYREVLEDLRLLTNYNMDSDNRLCLILVGLTELRRRLRMAVHESLAQRIVVRYHLAGLARDELPEYLTHRLRLAGCELAQLS